MLSAFLDKLNQDGQVYFTIKVRPQASETSLKGFLADGVLKIDIKGQPVGGKANKELINFLANKFLVNKKQVLILSGAGDRTKLIKILK